MKGGANLGDQIAIRDAVLLACSMNEKLDVKELASGLNITVECCQSFVDFYEKKESVTLPGKVAEPAKATTKKSRTKEPSAESEAGGFFGSSE